MKQVQMFAALLFPLAVFAQEGQAPNSSAVKVPRDFSLWYYPDSFNGRRGLRLDVFEITNAQDGSVTAKATMHGRGLDGCTIRSTPVTGKIENRTLFMRTEVKEIDNLTCRTSYEFSLGDKDIPEGGRYKSPTSAGSFKLN